MLTLTIIALLALLALLACIWLAYHAYRAPDMSRYDAPEPDLMMSEDEISAAHEAVVQKLKDYHALPRTTDVKLGRQRLEDIFFREVDAEIKPVDAGGVPGEWVLAEGADPDKRLLYIHGGAFMVGSPKSHRYITSELSRRAGVAVLAIDYRMMPEFKVIHCHEDVRLAYRWILEHSPSSSPNDDSDEAKPPTRLFVAGDSAGGNLTLAVIAWARDQGLPAADGAVAFAPLTDSTLSSPSWKTNRDTDPFLAPGVGRLLKIPRPLLLLLTRYNRGKPPNHPEMSPLFNHLGQLPPVLIQASKHEMLYSDALRYANKASAEGGQVSLQVWPRMVHVFQAFPELPESDDALSRAAAFMQAL